MQKILSQPCHRLFATLLVLLASLWMSRAPAADFAANSGGSTDTGFNQTASTFDAAGNVYIVGTFTNASRTIGPVTITRIGVTDTVVTKIDASGAVVWAKNFGGSGVFAYGKSIAVDASGNVYLGGDFSAYSAYSGTDHHYF